MTNQQSRSRVNPNSAVHWLDAAEEATAHSDVHSPATETVDFCFMDAIPILDDNPDQGRIPADDLERAATDIGFPAFVRSDLSSAKHSGIDAVRADTPDDLESVVASVVADSAHKGLYPMALLVREWIDIDHEFRAFDGLPIGAEYRLIAGPDDVQCVHYYWPEESIRDADRPPEEWQPLRDAHAAGDVLPSVRVVATRAARLANRHDALDPLELWSVDFARDADGEWWLIDMALAADSWHPECEVTTNGQ